MTSVLQGIRSGLLEVGVALLASSALDALFPVHENEALRDALLRLLGQSVANGAILGSLHALGFMDLETPTGLTLFAVLLVYGQRGLRRRFRVVADALQSLRPRPAPPSPEPSK